jgi:uncharacterized membrane protein
VVSLGAVGFALVRSGSGQGAEKGVGVGLSLLTVVLSWALVHTVFALKYARMYYEDGDGGVEFKGEARPTYGDFAYLAFTIGMTSNVSDTDIEDPNIRRTALRHALLAYLFGTGVLAAAINVVANLSQ